MTRLTDDELLVQITTGDEYIGLINNHNTSYSEMNGVWANVATAHYNRAIVELLQRLNEEKKS